MTRNSRLPLTACRNPLAGKSLVLPDADVYSWDDAESPGPELLHFADLRERRPASRPDLGEIAHGMIGEDNPGAGAAP